MVAELASSLASEAVESISSRKSSDQYSTSSGDSETAHPTVGVVDHISMLPLSPESSISPISHAEWMEELQSHGQLSAFEAISQIPSLIPMTSAAPTGWAARTVGAVLQASGVQVLWYGQAHPDLHKPLAAVRKESTAFFKQGTAMEAAVHRGQATVGAPPSFVENYNLQVHTSDKKIAQSLTKWVRSRDGGLPEVEALTLAYHDHHSSLQDHEDGESSATIYEVACNLLDPSVTSTQDIDERVRTWCHPAAKDTKIRGYRVGTTAQQCLEALERVSQNEEAAVAHDDQVRQRLENNFSKTS